MIGLPVVLTSAVGNGRPRLRCAALSHVVLLMGTGRTCSADAPTSHDGRATLRSLATLLPFCLPARPK